jgi:hypothetical protein
MSTHVGLVGQVTVCGKPDCAGTSLNACLYVVQAEAALSGQSLACVQSHSASLCFRSLLTLCAALESTSALYAASASASAKTGPATNLVYHLRLLQPGLHIDSH